MQPAPLSGVQYLSYFPRAALRLPWATCPHPHSGVNAKDMGNAKGNALGCCTASPSG